MSRLRYIEVIVALTAIETDPKGKRNSFIKRSRPSRLTVFIGKHPTRWLIGLKKGVVWWRWSVPPLLQWPNCEVGNLGFAPIYRRFSCRPGNYDQRDWGSEALRRPLELRPEMVHHL